MRRIPLLSSIAAFLLGSLILTAPLATAQTSPASLPGITVLGTGSASAPAETAIVVLMLGQGFYEEKMPPVESPGGTPGVSMDEAVAPVIAALVDAGVPEADIEILTNAYSGDYGPYGNPMTSTLRFDLTSPTTEQIAGILDAAVPAAIEAGLFVNMTGAIYGVADCATLERQAREASIANGRERASLQAELLGVSLGDVTASRDDIYGAMMYSGIYAGAVRTSSCSPGFSEQGTSALYGAAPFDPNMPAEVTVMAYTELTFEIGAGSGATPAS